ncbi:MAG: hypothetical protein CBD58_03375 [bacterium TMED198]|nr:MAG: hypothetical protein CBD58_03375 [bacterium TMED198]
MKQPMKPGSRMETIYLNDYCTDGIIKEKDFKEKLFSKNWSKFKGKTVLIKGCADIPIPTWAYMMLSIVLAQHCKKILFGEPCSAITLHNTTKDLTNS